MRSALVRLAGATGGWLLAGAASAALLVPTITTDELASPGEGCSLREAVLQANRNVVIDPACGEAGEPFPVADTIELAPNATYVLELTGEDDLAESGDLDISGGLVVLGHRASVEAAAGLGDRVLHVLSGVHVELLDLGIRGGRLVAGPMGAGGGGIATAGDLTMTRCTVEGNRVDGGFAFGGGIASTGRLELTDSVVRDNTATGSSVAGGGIRGGELRIVRSHIEANRAIGLPGTRAFVRGGGVAATGRGSLELVDSWVEDNVGHGGSAPPGDLAGIVFGGGLDAVGGGTVVGCTFSGNVARGGDGAPEDLAGAAHAIGGAIQLWFGRMTIHNSTFSGNVTLPGLGGGFERALRESVGAIFNQGTLALDSVTVTGSSAVGIYNSGGRVTLTNSLIALQTSGGDCAGAHLTPITSADYNLDSDGSCSLVGPNDQPAVAAEAVGLAPLAHNGGFAPTHLLQPWSAALDRGETGLEQDQRGVARPQRARDDVGAVEQDTFAVTDIPVLSRSTLAALAGALAFAALALLRRASG